MAALYKVTHLYRRKSGEVSSYDIVTLASGTKLRVKPSQLARLVANGSVENVRFGNRHDFIYNNMVITNGAVDSRNADMVSSSEDTDNFVPEGKFKLVRINKRYDGQISSLNVLNSKGDVLRADVGGTLRELRRNPNMFINVTYTPGTGWTYRGKLLFPDTRK